MGHKESNCRKKFSGFQPEPTRQIGKKVEASSRTAHRGDADKLVSPRKDQLKEKEAFVITDKGHEGGSDNMMMLEPLSGNFPPGSSGEIKVHNKFALLEDKDGDCEDGIEKVEQNMSVATCPNLGIKDSIPKSIPFAGKSLGEPNNTRGRKALVVHNPLTPVSVGKRSQQSSLSSFRLVGRSVGKAKVGKENNGFHGCNRLNTQVINHAMDRHRGEGGLRSFA
ncbi:hypothetical protein Dimus_000143 [Dionaea muscipula]